MLSQRHIQNMTEAKTLEPHWGYADRALPCTNDAGSCEYLDVVYHSHDLGILYSGIIWATVGAALFIWAFGRQILKRSGYINPIIAGRTLEQSTCSRNSIQRLQRSLKVTSRRWFLTEFIRPVFGSTTRLQVLILMVLVGYLTIWSFVGITYKVWITPVKNSTLHNTRSSLGPWADRVGVLAYALIPFSILLSSRESILSLLTGIPYQNFNFLHRWLGYIIFVQSILHTIGWTIIEVRLYQPQPKVARAWITQKYMVWGIVAQLLMIIIFVTSLRPVIRLTGYEFFRKVHYIIAMLFIGACWGHWQQLKCFLLSSLLVWFLDRSIRLIRTALIHYNYLSDGSMGFQTAEAKITHFQDDQHGDVIRLDFAHPQDSWNIGQHFYLCFPQLSVWQSHPFTPSSLPNGTPFAQPHSYIIRAKSGETKRLADLARKKPESPRTPVILTGPYGENTTSNLEASTNVLCIAGGTGITYVLPILLHLISQHTSSNRKVELIWAIRKHNDLEWVRPELDAIRAAAKSHDVQIRIFVTREDMLHNAKNVDDKILTSNVAEKHSSSSSSETNSLKQNIAMTRESLDHHMLRPDLHTTVTQFIDSTMTGPTIVYASGPGSMISDLRTTVASCNAGQRVWKGQERFDVDLICDNRLEW
jgi:predicted ferric reductase